MCDYWVHVAESLRTMAGVLVVVSIFASALTVPATMELGLVPLRIAFAIWGTCVALIVLCALALVFCPTGEIVAGWCAP